MLLPTLALACLAGFTRAAALDHRAKFAEFRAAHGKVYTSPAEEERRFQQFRLNLEKIERHNAAGRSWQMGVTQFADLSQEEFVKTYASGRLPARKFGVGNSSVSNQGDSGLRLEDLPDSVDWRDSGVVTGVRDQGACGSCWAFAASSAMASYAKIGEMSHDLLELSPQHLTSCTPNPLSCGGTGGCQGAIEPLAFTYASLFGVVTEDEYPYTSGHGSGADTRCDYDARSTPASVMTLGFETLPHNDQLAVMAHLANKGPLSASVAASDWGLYFGGVFDGCDYDRNIVVNHAVLLVGYGTDPQGGDYWLIKNSWSSSWGDDGYIKLKREAEPRCGTDSSPLDGSACVDGAVDSVHVCGTCAVLSDNSYPLGTHFVK